MKINMSTTIVRNMLITQGKLEQTQCSLLHLSQNIHESCSGSKIPHEKYLEAIDFSLQNKYTCQCTSSKPILV